MEKGDCMKTMKKQVTQAFNMKIYLLGRDKDGYNVYMEAPTWNCDWYWSLGYIERYTNKTNPEKAKDVESHTHWENGLVGYQGDDDYFVHHLNENKDFVMTTLTEEESWELAELMETCYTLRKSAEIFGKGGSHIANSVEESLIVQDNAIADRINKVVLPALFKLIAQLLTPKEEQKGV